MFKESAHVFASKMVYTHPYTHTHTHAHTHTHIHSPLFDSGSSAFRIQFY